MRSICHLRSIDLPLFVRIKHPLQQYTLHQLRYLAGRGLFFAKPMDGPCPIDHLRSWCALICLPQISISIPIYLPYVCMGTSIHVVGSGTELAKKAGRVNTIPAVGVSRLGEKELCTRILLMWARRNLRETAKM